MTHNGSNSFSNNSYIFNSKLKEIKQFCEQQIKIYVREIINPEQDFDYYITQSWLNINKPGEYHPYHFHPNSVISGVFYISTVEDDTIEFIDPNFIMKSGIVVIPKETTVWNYPSWQKTVDNNELILFPSWQPHMVRPNNIATKNRMSLAFNTFVRGNLGEQNMLNQLILQ
jgi:uncharacterized protein (TIGR02466 family)